MLTHQALRRLLQRLNSRSSSEMKEFTPSVASQPKKGMHSDAGELLVNKMSLCFCYTILRRPFCQAVLRVKACMLPRHGAATVSSHRWSSKDSVRELSGSFVVHDSRSIGFCGHQR